VSSGFGPPSVSQRSFLNLLLSSCAFIWLRVGFFFLLTTAAAGPSSVPLAAGVPAADCAGLCKRERMGVFVPLPFGDLKLRGTSSIAAAFP